MNVGFMDPYRADQLAFDFYPDKEHVPYLENTSYSPSPLNIYRCAAATHFYSALWWMKLQWRAYGAASLLRPRTLRVFRKLMKQALRIRARAAAFDVEHRGASSAGPFDALHEEFSAYEAIRALRPWASRGPGAPS